MADFDSNPFADPVNNSPFQDPSVQQATANSSRGLEEFNPFEDRNRQTTQSTPAVKPPIASQQQPAVVNTTSSQQPPAYTQSAAQPAVTAAQEDLLRRQEELEQKAAELQRREQQLRNAQFNTRENNWPPLPKWFPLKPCFYQDFSVDIPLEFQRIVKMGYYLWIAYATLMLTNFIVCAAYFGASTGLVNSTAGSCFGLSILLMVVFIPGAYVCWFRPVYKAFRSDSSFNFFLFFFIFFFQFIVSVVQAIGLDSFGTCGWINALSLMGGDRTIGQRIVAGIMLIIAALFSTMAVLDAIFLHKVHTLYRSTGASFEKAQQEFAKNVVSNPSVQSATKQAASAAVSGAVDASLNNKM